MLRRFASRNDKVDLQAFVAVFLLTFRPSAKGGAGSERTKWKPAGLKFEHPSRSGGRKRFGTFCRRPKCALNLRYSYTKAVKGMGKKKLAKHVERRHISRVRKLVAQINSIDIQKLLRGAAAQEKDKERKEQLNILSELFSNGMNDAWKDSGIVQVINP